MKNILLGILTSIYICGAQASTVEVDFLGKLDTIEEHVADPVKRLQGKYTIIEMMANCEFDEQCELNMREELEKRAKEEKNLMYVAFLKYLDWEKADLEYNIKHCQIEDKKAVRKIYAKCYKAWVEQEKNHPPKNRQEIDKIENDRNLCLQENELPLAEQGNIFAQADLLNLAEHFKMPGDMSKWEAKVNAFKGTKKYEQYMQCSEIP
ncbi:MAG: hypothetical protein JSR17_11985 [Proteobacteria bacterium]|nr:hypothetical protein [Pseudomonadota bacterium]